MVTKAMEIVFIMLLLLLLLLLMLSLMLLLLLLIMMMMTPMMMMMMMLGEMESIGILALSLPDTFIPPSSLEIVCSITWLFMVA